jgi:hypothetical protein
MTAEDRILMTRACEKLRTAPTTLTADEREVLEFYGTDSTRTLLAKADAPPTPTPVPRPPKVTPPVSRKELRQVIVGVDAAMRLAAAQIAALRDEQTKLREQLTALSDRQTAQSDRLLVVEAAQATAVGDRHDG